MRRGLVNQQLFPIVHKGSQVIAKDFRVYIYHEREWGGTKKENLNMGMAHEFPFLSPEWSFPGPRLWEAVLKSKERRAGDLWQFKLVPSLF